LKGEGTVRTLLEGWVVHYNYVRKHPTLKMTPAQASGLNAKNEWYGLIKDATKSMAMKEENQNPEPQIEMLQEPQPMEVLVK
jgi:hypothetical protein